MSQNTKRSAKMFKGDGSCVWCLYLVYFLILLDLATRCTEAYGNPSSDFSKHSIVRPKFHHTRTKREITTTQDEMGSHHPEVTLTVSIDGEEHELDLRLNEALVPQGHSLSYQQNGRTKVHVPEKEDLDICQYSGRVRGKPGSWAAVSTCHGVKGVLYDGRQLRYIEPAHDNDINADHFLYSHEHLAKEHRCGYEGGTTHNSSYDPMLFQQRTEELARKRSRVSRYKRDTYEDTLVREPYNADRRSRYVELVLVVDHGEFLASGGDLQLVHRQMKDLANIINSVYAPLNIFIALVGVEIWSENDEIVLEEDGDATLNKFLHYRKTVLVTRIPNDNAQLLTRQNFKAGVVGKALKGFMCSYNYSAGVATNHSRVIGLVAMTIAHEMGHNFGMEHDQEPDCECPDKKCIMSPSSTSVTPVHWSSCSLKSLALSFERGMDYCLRNKPKQLAESPTCGNGFLEEGEQCDCGTAPGAARPAAADRSACSACCRPDCTLRPNATCGHGQCCDLTTCRPKAPGTECRAADRECDLPEYCSGHSQFCPHDVHKMDATPCGKGQAYCVRGSCRSHTDQCRLLWGVTGASSDDKCYNNSNIKGDDHGNCGYDRVNQIYRRCAPQDVMCGMLQCRHLNERLEFGMENAAVLTATFINNNGELYTTSSTDVMCGMLQCRHLNERLEFGMENAAVLTATFINNNGELYTTSSTDVMCGMLQCRHLNERLEFGMENAAVLTATFINNNGELYTTSSTDVMCGMLQCRHLNERLEFGMENAAVLTATFINNNGELYTTSSTDVMCGMLQCRHLNERLEFGMENAAVLTATFINNNGELYTTSSTDVMCGMLQCRHLNERLEFGMENAAVLTATFINNNGELYTTSSTDVMCGMLQCRHLNERLEFGMENAAVLTATFINNNGELYTTSSTDVMCGMLQCRHLNERLEFGMENAAVLTATFINNNGVIIPCRTVIIDLGLSDVDPGLVPDGAKCGPDKMCMQQRCVSVQAVRAALGARGSVCPSNCSGHGLCNSNGNCHCEAGFAPPLCALPGPGGSYDSGPATDPTVQRNFMVVMYVIFLGIIPGILLVLFLVYYSRHNVLLWWKKPRKSVQSPKSSLQHRISLGAHKLAANFAPPPPAARPDDMSSSLLAGTSPPPLNPTVNFFGNFKGFSLAPIEKEEEKEQPKEPVKSAKITPVHRSGSNSNNLVNQGVLKPVLRSAPPLPVVPNSPKTSPSIKRTNSSVQRIKALMNAEKEDSTPVMATPPPRPVISSPILEASTCTAKELISPLGSKTLGPVRAAPNVPIVSPELPKRPLSMHASTVPQKPLPEEPKKVKEGISLNRIASFLKQDKPKEKERSPVERSHSLPKNPIHQIKVPKAVDKVALRNLQISNPILQKGIELPVATVPVVSDSEDAEDPKAFVNRTQSMRAAPVVPKTPLQTFGSMRQPSGAPRPISGVGRPTAPPPPAPIEETPVYQNPKPIDLKQTDYVDCIEEKQAPLAHIDEESGDNIYAIIEESPEKHSKPLPGVPPPIKTIPQAPPVGYNTPKPIPSNSGSTESMGLLGEIVDEIQNRNFDSIYSASTLRKKKGRAKENEGDRDSTYMNTAPESVYSNSGGKSVASTTSSGYLHPSAVNVPTYMNKDKVENKQEEKAPASPKANSKIPQFSRQVTPPNLKTFKTVPQSPKTTNKINPKITNSPDVVSSCAVADKTVKAPDVINNNKINDTPKVAAKPSITAKPNDNRPPLRPAPTADKKPTIKPTLKPVTNINKPQINRTNSKVDSNVAAIADNINKNKPKVVPKPTGLQRTDSNIKPNASKLTSKPSNVASLQQKFENRKSIGKEPVAKK
ncbi:uncharacterized protein LOC133529636 isoform X2 [Cydia pomonella]|uniref:uncharacterized protein LOC133529636 isoform X2 n=1 Tax=Cydia pomonella TaxID=82600 RepID=UPI002ADE4298|nr:uncharacterized protein LOC133529636 isoform X2 [Cydia pomonella]